MRFLTKVFLYFMLVLTIIMPVFGSLLLGFNFKNTLENESSRSYDNFINTRSTLQVALLFTPEDEQEGSFYQTMGMFDLSNDENMILMSQDGTVMYGQLKIEPDSIEDIEGKDTVHLIREGNTFQLLAMGKLYSGRESYILIQKREITSVFNQNRELIRYYIIIYIALIVFAALLSILFAGKLTQPIRALATTLRSYSQGDLSNRIRIQTNDEIGDLSEYTNKMADTIQEKIQELEDAAEQKDMFMSSFAHEIKTPLTSIIGYSEMLTRKECDENTAKIASNYIWSESMRLESLSLKLMKLFMLDKNDLNLVDVNTDEITEDLKQTLTLSLSHTKIVPNVDLESSYVRIEWDLLKTLIINLIDNARKAEAKQIYVIGKIVPNGYQFSVEDNGCGIPEKELRNILQPFYMVDKARSREKSGAGLGLALSNKIAQLHGTSLVFQSQQGVGTKVSFTINGGDYK